MATEVVIPKLGMTMKEGTIVEWTVPDGTRVEADQVVYRLATDKLDTEVVADVPGTLRRVAGEGLTLPAGTVVAWILADGEVAPPGPALSGPHSVRAPAAEQSTLASTSGAADDGRIAASPYARRLATSKRLDLGAILGSGPGGRIVAADVIGFIDGRPPGAGKAASRAVATPVARRRAEQLGVDIGLVVGTGPAGRITKDDVDAAAVAVPVPGTTAGGPSTSGSVPIRGMRKVIAERMHASLREMAQLTLGMEVDLTDAVRLRHQLLAEWEGSGPRVTYTDLVSRAAVKALLVHRGLNASVVADAIVRHGAVHLGLAVAVPNGLMVPVITDAHDRSLQELSAEAARLAEAAKRGTVRLDELEGSTFTVTALGGEGVDFFTPIINPPNVAILGVGRAHDGVGWEGERPVRRQLITLSLTIDHRAVDGAPGAEFLGTVRDLLESPYRLLV